jgi:hypothetical protein
MPAWAGSICRDSGFYDEGLDPDAWLARAELSPALGEILSSSP